MHQVYYSLDIRNDTKEAMRSRDYFPSRENLDQSKTQESCHVNTNGLVSSDLAPYTRQRRSAILDVATVPQPSSLHSIRHHQENLDIEYEGFEEEAEDPDPTQASWADFHNYMIVDKNWTDLFATAAAWMLLDFTFCKLTISSFFPPGR